MKFSPAGVGARLFFPAGNHLPFAIDFVRKGGHGGHEVAQLQITMETAKGKGASDTAKAAHFTADDFSGSNGKKSIPLYIRVLHECLGLIECGIVL
jgi:hypothetical protein